MQHSETYRDLNRTLQGIARQIDDSIDYASNWVAGDESPRELFNLLRQHVTYKSDPPGVELLQSMPSLFEDNYHGIPGAGDCDCFSITAAACCVALEIPVRLVVVGNSRRAPSHIYTEVLDRGTWKVFDLVQPYYNHTAPYKYKSHINVKF